MVGFSDAPLPFRLVFGTLGGKIGCVLVNISTFIREFDVSIVHILEVYEATPLIGVGLTGDRQ